ncbi:MULTISPECIES: MFS transporter [Arthrobacter]|uniref:MFS transporter n=1 Tax=Arthrobacter psychrochitiniphilus TaxID=291045 RepID=A0A2V3DSP9_9MICC|nr:MULTISPECIES: MFS transporter [Arthrobacter]NYG18809.1 MFS family permease [Arthrobacter psychrochitiniphilus]PXA66275.1 MFS transporter [Arthrobacter psychrochitiniphilus]
MPKLLADITPLRESRPFLRLWIGNGLSSIGTQLTVVAVSLEVYNLTGSTLAVGMLGLVALVPLVIAGLYGGAVADTHDRRKVALASSTVLWLVTIGIAAQAWLGLGNVGLLYGFIAIQSAAAGMNGAARSAIVPRLVRLELLPAANALSMIVMGLGTTVGPLLAGVLVANVGYAWTYSVDVLTFTASLWALFRLPPLPPLPLADGGTVQRAGVRSVLEGFSFLGSRKNVRMTFLVDMCAMVFALPRALLPAIGAVWLGGADQTAGLLLAAIAAGSFLAALFSGPLGHVRRQGLAVVWSITVWGGAVACLGGAVLAGGHTHDGVISPWLVAAVAALVVAGVADSVSSVFRSTILQAATPDHLRGRLQGIFVVVVTGGPRMGDVFSGATGSALGEGWAAVMGGLLCIITVWLLAIWQPGFVRYDARHPEP